MNDPDRRHPSDGFDDDTIFANIVAHLNDDAAEAERPTWPPAEDAATDNDATDEATDEKPATRRGRSDAPRGMTDRRQVTRGQAGPVAATSDQPVHRSHAR